MSVKLAFWFCVCRMGLTKHESSCYLFKQQIILAAFLLTYRFSAFDAANAVLDFHITCVAFVSIANLLAANKLSTLSALFTRFFTTKFTLVYLKHT